MTLEAIPKSFFYDNFLIVIYYGLHHILLVFTSSVVIVPHQDSGYKPGRIPVDRSLFKVLEVLRFSSQCLETKKS